jgi:hypothetical protein
LATCVDLLGIKLEVIDFLDLRLASGGNDKSFEIGFESSYMKSETTLVINES